MRYSYLFLYRTLCMIMLGYIISSVSAFGQPQKDSRLSKKSLDSVTNYYKLTNHDTIPIPLRLQYITSFLKGAYTHQNDSMIYKGLMRKTWLLGKVKQYDSAIYYTHQLHDFAIKKQDTVYINKAFIKFGIYHKKNYNLNESFKYYNESFKISRIIKDSILMGRSLLQMANIQTFLGDYPGSKTTAIDGLKYVETKSDLRRISGLYHIISVANSHQAKYEEAIRFNELALNLAKDSVAFSKIGIKNILIFKNTKALLLANLEEYDLSIQILKKLMNHPKIKEFPKEYARVLGNLGHVKWLKNPTDNEAKKLLYQSMNIRKEINDFEGLVTSYVYLTKYYFDINKTMALTYANNAYESSKKWKSLTDTLETLGFIFQLKDNVKEEAQFYDATYQKLNQIVQNNREIYATTKYENEQLAATNTLLKQENKKVTHKATLFLLLMIISIGGLGYYYFRQYQYKKRFFALQAATKTTPNKTKTLQTPKKELLANINSETLLHLLSCLQQFEEKQEYLTPKINAQTLSKKFKSNTSYISMVVNAYKQKNINQYINDLRVEHATKRLQTDPIFRKYTVKAIAQEVGFNSAESFAKKFYKETGIYPSYFIKKLEEANAID